MVRPVTPPRFTAVGLACWFTRANSLTWESHWLRNGSLGSRFGSRPEVPAIAWGLSGPGDIFKYMFDTSIAQDPERLREDTEINEDPWG